MENKKINNLDPEKKMPIKQYDQWSMTNGSRKLNLGIWREFPENVSLKSHMCYSELHVISNTHVGHLTLSPLRPFHLTKNIQNFSKNCWVRHETHVGHLRLKHGHGQVQVTKRATIYLFLFWGEGTERRGAPLKAVTFCLRISNELVNTINEICSIERVPTNSYTGGLAKSNSSCLEDLNQHTIALGDYR